MLGDYTICTATSGNGVPTLGITVMLRNRRTSKTIATLYGQIAMNLVVYCAVVLGSTFRGTVARRFGSGALRSTGATTSVFAWFFFRSRIPYPFYFYPFSLSPDFPKKTHSTHRLVHERVNTVKSIPILQINRKNDQQQQLLN